LPSWTPANRRYPILKEDNGNAPTIQIDAAPPSTLRESKLKGVFHLPMIQAKACLFLDRMAMDAMVVDLMANDAIG
jgi:hypothetical protein